MILRNSAQKEFACIWQNKWVIVIAIEIKRTQITFQATFPWPSPSWYLKRPNISIGSDILKMKKWSSQWPQCMQLRKEAWRKKNAGLQRGLNPWPRDYRCDALPTELWNHWRWEQVNCGKWHTVFSCSFRTGLLLNSTAGLCSMLCPICYVLVTGDTRLRLLLNSGLRCAVWP